MQGPAGDFGGAQLLSTRLDGHRGRAARDPTSNKLFQDSIITAILLKVPVRYCLYVDGNIPFWS